MYLRTGLRTWKVFNSRVACGMISENIWHWYLQYTAQILQDTLLVIIMDQNYCSLW